MTLAAFCFTKDSFSQMNKWEVEKLNYDNKIGGWFEEMKCLVKVSPIALFVSSFFFFGQNFFYVFYWKIIFT